MEDERLGDGLFEEGGSDVDEEEAPFVELD